MSGLLAQDKLSECYLLLCYGYTLKDHRTYVYQLYWSH